MTRIPCEDLVEEGESACETEVQALSGQNHAKYRYKWGHMEALRRNFYGQFQPNACPNAPVLMSARTPYHAGETRTQESWCPLHDGPGWTTIGDEESKSALQVRHVAFFAPFTGPYSEARLPSVIDGVAAALLALHHFNNGVGSIIPEFAALSEACPVRFSVELFDDALSPQVAAGHFKREILPRVQAAAAVAAGRQNDVETSSKRDHDLDRSLPAPTALFGSHRSVVTGTLSTLASIYDIPTLSYSSPANFLDNSDMYPLLVRTVPSNGPIVALTDFVRNILNITHVGLIYVTDEAGENSALSFREVCLAKQMSVVSSSLALRPTHKQITDALRPLANSGYRYFVAFLFANQVKSVMPAAKDLGIAGPGTFWLFTGVEAIPPEPLDSKFADAMNGTATAKMDIPQLFLGDDMTTSRREDDSNYDRFRSFALEFQKAVADPDFYSFLDSLLPPSLVELGHFNLSQRSLPLEAVPSFFPLSSFDAVTTLIIASCRAAHSALDDKGKTNQDASQNLRYSKNAKFRMPGFFNGTELYNHILDTTFRGASGDVIYDRSTRARQSETAPFVIKNVVTKASMEAISFHYRVTHAYGIGNNDSVHWFRLHNGTDFIYSDGREEAPKELPEPQIKLVLLSYWARAFGWALVSVTVATSIALIFWITRNRRTVVVRNAQPSFLYVICVGTTLMSLSIVPLSFQEPASRQMLHFACMAAPWFFCVGFVTAFSALLSKLTLVHRIFNYNQRGRMGSIHSIDRNDVFLPFVAWLSLNLIVLAAWTATAPLVYLRLATNSRDRYGREDEYYGSCVPLHSKKTTGFFIGAITLVNLAPVISANIQAYRTREINDMFTDSRLVWESTVFLLQAALVGTPIPFLSFRSRYIVLCCLIVAACLGVLLPIFQPKIVEVRKELRARRDDDDTFSTFSAPTPRGRQATVAVVGTTLPTNATVQTI